MWKSTFVSGFLLISVWLSPVFAEAESVTWSFMGEVWLVNGDGSHTGSVAEGELVTGFIQFDLDAPETGAGQYHDSIRAFELDFGGGDFVHYSFNTGSGDNFISSTNDNVYGADWFDAYLRSSSHTGPLDQLDTSFTYSNELLPWLRMEFYDAEGDWLDDSELFSAPPPLSMLEHARLRWDYATSTSTSAGQGNILIDITDISLSTSVVPVPPALGLGLLGLGIVGIVRRRNTNIRQES